MLPRDIRCRVISLLLGAVKIERDQHIVSGALYCYFLKFFIDCYVSGVFLGPIWIRGVLPYIRYLDRCVVLKV